MRAPVHVDAVTDESKLFCQNYLKRQYSKNNHPYNPIASLFPALGNMKVITELMAGLCNIKLANTKQAKVIYNHTYTKEKLLLEKGIYFELCKIIFIYFTNGRYIDLCDQ